LPFQFYLPADLLDQLIFADNWENLCSLSKKRNINFTISSIGELKNIQGGAHIANNPILTLNSNTDPIEQFSKNHRQNIKKERNKAHIYKIKICFSESFDDLNQFYDILATQYVKNHKMIFQPFSIFSKLWTLGLGKLIVAKHQGEVLAGIFCLLESDGLHYNWGARKSFLNLHLGTLLLDNAIFYAYSKGLKFFNFGSTPLSDIELFNFKMKWGCKNLKVYKYSSINKISLIDLNSSFRSFRNIYSKIHPKVAQQIMPTVVPFLVR
jgi:lipid II:glycine glycyltransferase (peptidoglycan interpeptide bridge formation enzyme)